MQFEIKRKILTVFLVLLCIGSIIKPSISFYLGGDRHLSNLITLIGSMSEVIGFIFILLSLLLTLQIGAWKQIPAIPLNVKLLLAFKAWAFILTAITSQISFEILFSALLAISLSFSILVFYRFHQEVCIKAVYWVAIIFVCLNMYEVLSNPDSVVWGGRFYGVTNHPNFIGGYSALLIPFVLFVMNDSEGRAKIIPSSILIILIFFVASSGSRSSLAAMLIAIFLFFNISKSLGWGKVIYLLLALLALLGITSYDGDQLALSRLISTNNTRSFVNYDLWNTFLNSPFLGNTEIESTSNSYLSAFARYGILGGSILLALVLLILKYSARHLNTNNQVNIPVIISLLFYAAFEGVLIENYSFGQIIFVITITLLSPVGERNKENNRDYK